MISSLYLIPLPLTDPPRSERSRPRSADLLLVDAGDHDVSRLASTGDVDPGIDKQKVGQTAAEIRSLREPDPYKGKGIKYSDEIIRARQEKQRASDAKRHPEAASTAEGSVRKQWIKQNIEWSRAAASASASATRCPALRRVSAGGLQEPQAHLRAVIDDASGQTLARPPPDKDSSTKGANAAAAKAVGALIARRRRTRASRAVVFDRGGYLYHGNVKALADAARENGLEF